MTGCRVCLPVKTREAIQPVAAHEGIHHCHIAALTMLLSRLFAAGHALAGLAALRLQWDCTTGGLSQ